MEQPVIRNKLAHMVSQVEAVQNWLESITYQMNNMTFAEQQKHLAGPIALLKLLSTRYAANIVGVIAAVHQWTLDAAWCAFCQ